MPENILSNEEIVMRENAVRLEVARMIRKLGFDDYHPPDMANNASLTSESAPGRPDLFGLNSIGPTVVIEVKVIEPKARVEPWIDPSKISDRQRNWLDWWVFGRHGNGFLAVGTIFGNPRRLWVIPWMNWDLLERSISERNSQNMSPPALLPPVRITLTDLDVMRIFECKWMGKSVWELPEGHPILSINALAHDPNQRVVKSFRYEVQDLI